MSDAVRSRCNSGGARGSDIAWGDAARRAGHDVCHWSFEGHHTRARRDELRVLDLDELAVARPRLEIANATLGRRVPRLGTPVGNLIHRNWYQVREARALFAVSTFKDSEVDGGTAWATRMFIDLRGGAACEAYVFDQEGRRWYKWEGSWVVVAEVPVPWGEYAGVGTRDINEAGLGAIRSVYARPVQAPVPASAAVPGKLPVPFRLPPRDLSRRR